MQLNLERRSPRVLYLICERVLSGVGSRSEKRRKIESKGSKGGAGSRILSAFDVDMSSQTSFRAVSFSLASKVLASSPSIPLYTLGNRSWAEIPSLPSPSV